MKAKEERREKRQRREEVIRREDEGAKAEIRRARENLLMVLRLQISHLHWLHAVAISWLLHNHSVDRLVAGMVQFLVEFNNCKKCLITWVSSQTISQ